MANKRVSQLSPIAAADVAPNDLFLLADVSAIESKKLTVSDLRSYLQINITASATASYALNARTASYLLYQGFPNGTASFALTSSYNLSSSHARWADTASHALFALSASYARSSSYALTASYAHTSSVQLIYSSAFADQAKTASFLLYSGVPNGTASYAINAWSASNASTAKSLAYPNNSTASLSISSLSARTSSFILYSGRANGTASYALRAGALESGNTASYLNYTLGVPNGTASFAVSGTYAGTSSISQAAISASYATVAGSVLNTYGTYIKENVIITGDGLNTASFDFHVTTSNWMATKMIVEVSGDIRLPISTSNWIDPESTHRSLRIGVETIDGGPPVGYQSYKPISIVTDATQSFMLLPFTAKTILSSISQRAYRLTLNLYGSASFINTGAWAGGYGDGLNCFLHTNATNINFV